MFRKELFNELGSGLEESKASNGSLCYFTVNLTGNYSVRELVSTADDIYGSLELQFSGREY